MLDPERRERLERAAGGVVRALRPLHGGCIAQVLLVTLEDGTRLVCKADPGPRPRLDIEGMMLDCLARTGVIPVPGVRSADPDLLVLEYVEHDGARSDRGEREAAEMLARLHACSSERYGYDTDTLIGSLDQANPESADWPRFFAEHRLLTTARLALGRGAITAESMSRLERLASDIDRYIDPPPTRPALIHGDVWGGNVLWRQGRIAAFIDPAIYFADPEIELAFIDLFSCFGDAFWTRYTELAPIRPGFREVRVDLYNLYPLLVHAALFAGGYGASVAANLDRLGIRGA